MVDSHLPLLSLMLITLPIGAVLIWLLPNERYARVVALVTALVDLLFALWLLFRFDPTQAGFQFVERSEWIPTLNIHYLLGIDGISAPFLPLTVLLFIGVILASWNSVRTQPRLYYTLLLLLESVTLGIFCALDTMLFFLFWELTLIPLYFLISLWGVGPNRRYAAVKYTLFMLTGGVPLLFGILLLAFGASGADGLLVFDYRQLLELAKGLEGQTLVFLLLLVGFGVKAALFPFHTWLPTVAVEGPIGVGALLTGLKLGAYGLIRFTVPLAPGAASELHWLLAGLGVIGILYGALAAINQSNLRRLLAYASISHIGLVLLGIASFTLQGIQGALFQLLNFTFISGGLFLLAGFLHHRTGSTDLTHLGGVAKSMPLLASFTLLFGLASLGMPGTAGFPAELLILLATLKSHTGAGLAALFGVVLGAVYLLGFYRRAFLGPVRSAVVADAVDLQRRERVIALLFAALILFLGLSPASLLDLTQVAAEGWLAQLP